MTRTLQELAQEALDVQNACNLCGVAQSFAEAMKDLNRLMDSTISRNQHPIAIAWLDKMNSLAAIQAYEFNSLSAEKISDAFIVVEKLSRGESL